MTRGFRLHSRYREKTKPMMPVPLDKLHPQRRKGGGFVTMENCARQECRWPYGEPGAEMMMCGRAITPGKPYCADHQAAVPRKGGGIY